MIVSMRGVMCFEEGRLGGRRNKWEAREREGVKDGLGAGLPNGRREARKGTEERRA